MADDASAPARASSGRFRRWLGRGALAGTALHVVLLAALLPAVEWHGERHWFTGFCLYVPPTFWLLPLLVLTPLCAWLRRRCLWAHGAAVLAVLVAFMDLEISPGRTPCGKTLRVVTNNFGQNNRQSLTPFIEAERPDVIALQETPMRARQFAAQWTGYHFANHGEFVLLSRLPIVRSGLVPVTGPRHGAVAAWFEVVHEGRVLVIYNVHMPTPRHELNRLAGPGFLRVLVGLVRPGGRSGTFLRDCEAGWRARVETGAQLAAVFEQEKRPFIALGDFNCPNRGAVYRRFAAGMRDAFEETGRGYGFTVPGKSWNPLSLFGPWLRIDHVWTGGGVMPVECRAEADRASQHRAVAAVVELP